MTTSTSKPLHLSLFPNQIQLTHSIPDANRHRFYLLRTLPTLFGEWALPREWGRIASHSRVRRDRHRTEGDQRPDQARPAKASS